MSLTKNVSNESQSMPISSMEYEFVAITNIPNVFKTADLRSYFSEYVENSSFYCFHYRHRPEKNKNINEQSQISNSSRSSSNYNLGINDVKRCCVVKMKPQKASIFKKRYDKQNWIRLNDEYLSELCEVELINTKTREKDDDSGKSTSQTPKEGESKVVDENVLSLMSEMNPPKLMPQGNVGTPTKIFLNLIQQCLLPQNLIQKLNLKFPSCSGQRLYSNVGFEYFSSHYQSDKSVLNQNWFDTGADTAKISILSSRSVEHNGCKDSIIIDDSNKSLVQESDEVNHKQKCNSETNPFDVIGSDETLLNIEKSQNKCSTVENIEIESECSPSKTYKCNLKRNIFSSCKEKKNCVKEKSLITKECHQFRTPDEILTNKEIKRRKLEDKNLTKQLMAQGIEEHLIAVDKKWRSDDDAEEWDRHEASEDDPTNQGRCKERLYEEEIEQPWEKGGPGVVFWTDAIYWQAKEGDFDEQTTDDLDVDFSPYEEPGAGDKDIKDFLKIRQEQRWRNGYDSTDRFSIGIGKKLSSFKDQTSMKDKHMKEVIKSDKLITSTEKIGKFEKHSKGIGRKVMEKYGWREGFGLGSSKIGITEALRGDGQKPCDRSGLGFVAERPVRYGIPPINKTWTKGPRAITTVFDDPAVVDPKEPLLMRGESSTLKHRKNHIEKFKYKRE